MIFNCLNDARARRSISMRKVAVVNVLLFGFICFVSCEQLRPDINSTALDSKSIGDREKTDYVIYSVLIEKMYINERIKLIVIKDHTGLHPPVNDLNGELKRVESKLTTISPETLNDFQEKNKESSPLEKAFKLSLPYVLFSEQEDKEIFQDARSWQEFYKRYPDSQGLITLSKVGFNKGMNQALVYIGNQRYGLGGAGYYVLLSKKNDIWSIQDMFGAWVS